MVLFPFCNKEEEEYEKPINSIKIPYRRFENVDWTKTLKDQNFKNNSFQHGLVYKGHGDKDMYDNEFFNITGLNCKVMRPPVRSDVLFIAFKDDDVIFIEKELRKVYEENEWIRDNAIYNIYRNGLPPENEVILPKVFSSDLPNLE